MRPPTVALCLVISGSLWTGCAVDYGLADVVDPTLSLVETFAEPPLPVGATLEDATPPAEYGATDEADGMGQVSVQLDAAFQRNRWGSHISRCQVQLSFHHFHLLEETEETEETDGDAASEENEPAPDEGNGTDDPAAPGDCVFDELDPDEGGGGDPGDGGDDWYESGELAGPEMLYLLGETTEWELELTQAEDGRLRYELDDCSVDTFPFGEVLDLVVPDELGHTDPFTVPEVLVVGAELTLLSPDEGQLEQDQFVLEPGMSLAMSWEREGGDPVLADGTIVAPELELKLHNGTHNGSAFQFLDCAPDHEEGTEVTSSSLAQFSFNEDPDEQHFDTYLDLHAVTHSPGWTTPWGGQVQVKTTVSAGGGLFLEGS